MAGLMKRNFRLIQCGLILPLVFSMIYCCCLRGEANAAIMGIFPQQSKGAMQDHTCCPPTKSPHNKKCDCQHIVGTVENGMSQKVVVSPKTNWLPHPSPFVAEIGNSIIASGGPSGRVFYISLTQYSQSDPPIYLSNRVFRL